MPYRTIKRGRRSFTRKVTRKGYGGRKPRRSYATRRRRYPIRMSKKRILNISSRKKQDTMLSITNIDAGTVTPGPLRTGPSYLSGQLTYLIPFVATARPALQVDGSAGSPIERAVRTSQTCFMRGLKEKISIRTDTGAPWRWRRIAFTYKGDTLYSTEAGQNRLMSYFKDTGTNQSGMARIATTWTQSPPAFDELCRILFKGTRNLDWDNEFIAPTDTARVKIVYDKTTTIQAGNEAGVYRTYSRWHGMNKNLVYDDDEEGTTEGLRRFSVEGPAGMGDYYIFDFFQSNGNAEDQLALSYNSTLYWHEK
ncbi:capsid protein [Delphin genomovirus 2]|nr:capsid protein [Delphin genomovirus 2]